MLRSYRYILVLICILLLLNTDLEDLLFSNNFPIYSSKKRKHIIINLDLDESIIKIHISGYICTWIDHHRYYKL